MQQKHAVYLINQTQPGADQSEIIWRISSRLQQTLWINWRLQLVQVNRLLHAVWGIFSYVNKTK